MENEITIKPYSWTNIKFIRAFILTMRPYLLFVSGITGIAGMSFVENLGITAGALIFTASFLSYGFGQALTDCFQIDTDSISSPYRPLTQGVVSKKHFLIVSVIGLSACIAIFTVLNPLNLLLGILSGFGLFTYTYFKKKWWAGPFYNSWIVASLFLIAYLAGKTDTYLPEITHFISAILVVFTGYANFVLTGYFKDIEADKKTGYNTLPVVYGRKISAVISDLFALTSCIAAALIILPVVSFEHFSEIPMLLFLGSGVLHSLTGQIKLHKVKRDKDAHDAISHVVHAYILLLSAVALLYSPGWFLFLVLFYLSFNIILTIRPCKNQV